MDKVMDGVFDDIYMYHNGPYKIGTYLVEFTEENMKCSGPLIEDTCFSYHKENVLPAMLFLDTLVD